MTFEEGMKKSIEELVDKKTALEKRIFELEKENEDLKAEIGLNEATIQEQLEDRVKVIKENEELKKQIDCYKAFESHYDEIEEDAKAIAKENEELKKNSLVWHKVADGDYPPCERGNYSINVLTDRGDIAYYNYDDECWVVEPSSAEIDPPVAWCEIPKYEGKK